jgi:hypothetical protein
MYYLFVLTSVTIGGMPLALALWLSWTFRRDPRPPVWPCVLLLFASIGIFWMLTQPYGATFFPPFLSLSGMVACLLAALALGLRRSLRWSNAKAFLTPLALIVPAAAWADLRFRVIVEDSSGQPVEIRADALKLSYQNFLSGYQEVRGKRLCTGSAYFGLCHWLRHKGEWGFWGNLSSPGGYLLGKQGGQSADWSKWPMRVKTDPALEQEYRSEAGRVDGG